MDAFSRGIEIVDQHSQDEHGYFEGTIYIEGPIAYGPERYYKYLSKIGIKAEQYEPLIQVTVHLDDKSKNNVSKITAWTNNTADYDSLKQREPNKRKIFSELYSRKNS